ncbi:MAG TPA: TIGR03618 family F420-dependent PPOX class oxidoreductase [Acidimicrobiales bacterium]|jgi:PPOX class probable F420-dependent enzyme|nr:TIGR03618 family F420-dependent PPOX class oxidoreductase [Acidimicrobiales bacterium]HTW07837.1 TIGR03618 family F420-dependent PPOX class oxidoreductase [Acidimicrobiales bacterium]
MEIADALEHFRHNHRAVLVTRRRDGRLQMSPVVQAVGNDGRVLISTRAPAMKVRNIRRDPAVSICALNEAFFGKWAQIDGRAAIVEMPEAMALLRLTYVQVAGEHPDWDEFERDMIAQNRVVVAIKPESAGPDVAG